MASILSRPQCVKYMGVVHEEPILPMDYGRQL